MTKMSSRGWRGGSLMLFVFAAVAALGQSRPLNPTVTVLPRAVAPVPADCDIGPATPSEEPVRVAELQLPQERSVQADMAPPPSTDLRSTLREAQEASARNDRTAFNDAVTRARAILANYPPGGEKTAASDAIAVYNDLLRLWNYQFDAPAGSFFDAESEGGALLQMMNKYPGWSAFIADQTINAGGTKVYPTRESREFLSREAAQRLTRLGIQTPVPRQPARPAPAPRTAAQPPSPEPTSALPSVVPRRTPAPAMQPSTTTTPRRPPRSTVTTPRKTSASRSTPASRPSPTPRTTSTPKKPAAQPEPQPVTRRDPVPMPAPAPAPPTDEELAALGLGTSTKAPPPITPVQPPPADPATVPSGATTATDTVAAMETTDTTATMVAETATAAQEAETPAPARRPNFIIPVILILIGIGVLIVLFRASS